jgi:hypothetical protein
VGLILLAIAILVIGMAPAQTRASSHREAPLISTDPEADNTDVYAFVSPDMSNTVTIVANYSPLEEPAGGPNFNAFADNVLYEINVDNNGDGADDITYQFEFETRIRNRDTFLYNTGPITSLDDPDWNMPQTYDVRRIQHHHEKDQAGATVDKVDADRRIGRGLKTPPVNIGPRSTPNYDALANAAIASVDGRKFFAGQRADPFFVDLGSIFDLAGLRPFNSLHVIPLTDTMGINTLKGFNTHSIVMQVPISDLTRNHRMPTGPTDPNAVVGIYASASRAKYRVLDDDGTIDEHGPYVQVSRLGEPLINEVIIPLGKKDRWNAKDPENDSQFLTYYRNPEITHLENILYPALDNANEHNRNDLVTILLTGVPGLNFTGNTKADLVRLNMMIPPSATDPNGVDRLGAIAGQLDGFPNGRRLADDVVDIELRATAEGYGPILHNLLGLPNRTPNNLLGDGVDGPDKPFLAHFPYVASPYQGYDHAHHPAVAFAEHKMEMILNR